MDPFLGLGLPNEQELDPYADLLGLPPTAEQPGNWLPTPSTLPQSAAIETAPRMPAPIQLSVSVQQAIEDAVRVSVVRAVITAVRLVTGGAVGLAEQATR
jgi:hypothetical protein